MQIISKENAKSQGLKRYFTGIPCKNGHVSEFLIKTDYCVECSKIATKQWRLNNKESLRVYEEKRRKLNPSRCNKYKTEWKKRNPEKNKQINEKYRLENKDAIIARCRKFREENIEKINAYHRERNKTHIYQKNFYTNQRRAAKTQATPSWADKKKIAEFYKLATELNMTVDHVIPLNGKLVCGLHVENNLQLLTSSENSKKGNRFEII